MRNFVKSGECLQQINLYEDPSSKTLDLSEIASYLQNKFDKIPVDIRKSFITSTQPETVDALARKLAGAKVRDLNRDVYSEPMLGEIEFERKLLMNPELRLPGVLYDGFKLQSLLRELIPKHELDSKYIHVIFTNRLFSTFDEIDRRYHARVSVYGFPTLISTTGIVEAPAKPKNFYELKRQYAMFRLETPLEVLKERFKGMFIDYDDERLTEVMKGYVMQAIFYHVFGNPFCDKVHCRLYNAHWQEEVIKSQLEPRELEFCDQHQTMLDELKAELKFSR